MEELHLVDFHIQYFFCGGRSHTSSTLDGRPRQHSSLGEGSV